MSNLSTSLRDLAEQFRQHQKQNVPLQPITMSSIAALLDVKAEEAKALEKMLERRLRAKPGEAPVEEERPSKIVQLRPRLVSGSSNGDAA